MSKASWLTRDWVAAESFFVWGGVDKDAREAWGSFFLGLLLGCCRGFVGGWLLRRWNSAKTASKILELASGAAQTARIFEAAQISTA